MRCTEFELALQRQLDGEAVAIEDGSMREHALSCDSCRELQEGMQLLIQGFALDRIPPVPSSLADRICVASKRGVQRPPVHVRSHLIRWLVAAVAVGAVGIAVRSLTSTQNAITMLTEPSATRQELKPQEVLFPELAGPDELDQRESIPILVAVEPVSRLFQAVGKTLGDPVRPIAVSTSEAMSNLIRELPDTEVSAIPIPISVMRDMMGSAPSKKMPGMVPSS